MERILVHNEALGRTKTVRAFTRGLARVGWVPIDEPPPAGEPASDPDGVDSLGDDQELQVRQEGDLGAEESGTEGDHSGPENSEGAVNDG